jgi:ubiquinone/menaquinone biosynthesis C-methylase UbiE
MWSMSEHKEKFTGRVQEYSKYRLRYSQHVMEVLRARCGLAPEDVIADVGAGTGMLAEIFLAAGNSVIAIEPNAEMLAACEALKKRYPALRTVQAAAEATTLADASVDLVAVGRAFHWFDTAKALAEFRRILRPGGWVVLASVGRRKDGNTVIERAYEALLRSVPEFAETIRRFNVYDRAEELFPGGRVLREKIESVEWMTLEELVGQTQSFSFTPHPGEPGYDALQEALREFFAAHAVEGRLAMPVASYLICGQFAE